MTACGFREAEPQINADERRYEPVTELGAAHRKVRKYRKAQPQCGTRMTRIGRIYTDPCASASTVAPVDVAHTYGSRHTWRSAFHHVCSSLKNPASDTRVSAFIRVHPRFYKNVIFQTGLTGLTGYVFNPVHPVILSNLKYQPHAPRQSVRVEEM